MPQSQFDRFFMLPHCNIYILIGQYLRGLQTIRLFAILFRRNNEILPRFAILTFYKRL